MRIDFKPICLLPLNARHVSVVNLILILVLMLALAGCSWSKPKTEKTAEELAADGRSYFTDEKYDKAISSYKKLKDWYPFSVHAKEAELKIADAHYRRESYDEAILAYNEYERMHPNDEKVPYVIYQVGRCDFDRMETVDRDATATRQALQTFQRLVTQFPESEYAEKAASHIDTCLRQLAAKEMDIGLFYFNFEKYEAALYRFAAVVEDYPDFGLHQQALDYTAKCRTKIEAQQKLAAAQVAASSDGKKDEKALPEKDYLTPAEFFY